MVSLAAAAKPAIKNKPALQLWCPLVLSDVRVLMCSSKMLVVMSITIQLYRSLVILYYCWSNIWSPKFKVCLWITEDSCQNRRLKYRNFISCASAYSRCQARRKLSRGVRQERYSQHRALGISGSPEYVPLRVRSPVSWIWTNWEQVWFSLSFWEVMHKPPAVSGTDDENHWPRLSAERVEEKKGQLLCIAPNTAKTDFRETCTLPRAKATLRFIGISNVFWGVRRSSAALKMNCCSSRAGKSADVRGYASVKIDSWSLGKILVTRQNGNWGKKYSFSQV